jgi:hypothetical protein
MSKVRTFVNAVKTGMTHTTKVLDIADYKSHIKELRIPGALSSGPNNSLPDWAKKELSKSRGKGKPAGLKPKELEHISEWPLAQRESVRKAIVKAVDGSRSLQFFWELYADENEGTRIQGLTGTGDIMITFLSPRALLTAGKNNKGQWDIKVGVTKPNS